MAIHSQILIGPWRMGRPLIGAKGFQSFHWTRGTSSRKVMEVTKRKGIVCMRGEEVEEKLLVLMCARIKHGGNVCNNQTWRECVQESNIGRMCVRIRHEKDLCSKYLLQSLWTLVLISSSSQIHRWICVKIQIVLVWKV
jgi:hypothetical protein